MSEIRYFKPLTAEQVVSRATESYKSLSYLDVVDALGELEECHITREPLIREARKLIDKDDLTSFEAIFLMMVLKHLQSEISLEGDNG